jgi:N-methylhydantoinase A/oxoprolinase/acetone carboxylase beta subunit
MVNGFRNSLADNGIENVQIYLSQNDGTLMTADYALKFPVLTIASGPTNSIRGASYLCKIEDALVIDVGGTTTDIGVLTKGFPRESSLDANVGGVRINFRMPDLFSFGLGGGTLIRGLGTDLQIGPESVGYRLPQESLVFGGDVLTASDIGVAVGQANIGDASKVSHLPREAALQAFRQITAMVEEAIDRMKTSADPVPAILVGGGSVLLPDQLKGVSEVIRPEHFEVANAIGVTIAQVSGQIDRIYAIENKTRDEVLEDCKNMAIEEAIRAGALADTVQIVDIEEIPLAYLPGNAIRMRAKAVGALFRT